MSGEVVEIRTFNGSSAAYEVNTVGWGEVVKVNTGKGPLVWIIVADANKIYIDVLFRIEGSGKIYASPLGIVEV